MTDAGREKAAEKIADTVMQALAAAMEKHLEWTEIEAKHPRRFKAVKDEVRDALIAALSGEAVSPAQTQPDEESNADPC